MSAGMRVVLTVVTVALSACSGPSEPKGPWHGTWKGTESSSRTQTLSPGNDISQTFPEMGNREWSLEQCGETLGATVMYGCVLRLKVLSDTEAEVLPDYPCDVDEGAGPFRIYTTGGSAKQTDGSLVFTVSWSGIEATSTGNFAAKYTSTLTATRSKNSVPAVNRCDSMTSPNVAPLNYASEVGCAAGDIEDHSAASDPRVVNFTVESGYQPRCMGIAKGQSVTFKGNFNQYPLYPGTPGKLRAGSVPNPIKATLGLMEKDYGFADVGDFLYRCQSCPAPTVVHTGLVRVR